MKTYKANLKVFSKDVGKELEKIGVTLGKFDYDLYIYRECSFDEKTKEKLDKMIEVMLSNLIEFEETNIREVGNFE